MRQTLQVLLAASITLIASIRLYADNSIILKTERAQRRSRQGRVDDFHTRDESLVPVSTSTKLTSGQSKIPDWMKEYFSWHRNVTAQLNETNWGDQHYLLLRCVTSDKKCSGTSDRLQAIPVILRMAYDAKRLFYLAWSRPAPIEEFLVPPADGFDWRLPTWLAKKIDLEKRGPKYWLQEGKDSQDSQWLDQKEQVVRMKTVRAGGFDYYNRKKKANEATFEEAYTDVWNALFEPSPQVAQRVQQEMDRLHLVSGQYVGTHLRTQYISNTFDDHEEEHALTCAKQIAGGQPIFFASDSLATTSAALRFAANHSMHVVSSNAKPIHLDRGADFLSNSDNWRGRPVSDFYDVFVDFYLLSRARCLVHGIGGYGSWAGLVGGLQNCSVSHRESNCTLTA